MINIRLNKSDNKLDIWLDDFSNFSIDLFNGKYLLTYFTVDEYIVVNAIRLYSINS